MTKSSHSYRQSDSFGDLHPIDKTLLEAARALRKNQTKAEQILWQELRRKQICNTKFSRQHPIQGYVLDFYARKIKLAIELDGNIHNKPDIQSNDLNRQLQLENLGITFLRFTNEEVTADLAAVINRIEKAIKSYDVSPSSWQKGPRREISE